MNCAAPTDFSFSFRGFAKRGGETDKHEHGWGIAIYEGRGLRTFLDPMPAAISPVAQLVQRYPMKTFNMMAHIRYATQGTVSLENVHPFQREMWGIQWSFCHNGEVPKYSHIDPCEYPLLGNTGCRQNCTYHPVGDTDSEAVFCAILNALKAEFNTLPTLPVLYETIQRLSAEIVSGDEELTIFNFLLGCGQYTLFAYSWPGARPGSSVWNGLFYTIRRPPFSTAKLADVDYAVDFSKLTTPADRVAVIATKPLTVDEDWKEFKRGQLLMFDNGLPYSELYDCDEVEQEGRGLCSRVLRKSSGRELMMTGCMKFDTPALLRRLVDECLTSGNKSDIDGGNEQVWARNGVDLGCGSGRSGLAFRSCVKNMTGVDLSSEMIDKARERGCYDRLVVGDVEHALHQCGAACADNNDENPPKHQNGNAETNGSLFDLIIACDVLVYIHDLQPVFESVRNSLMPNDGLFAFSAEFIEEQEPSGEGKEEKEQEEEPFFVLQSCARFAHKRHYVEKLVRDLGFEIKALKVSKLRKNEGRDIEAVLGVLGLPS